MTGRLVLLVSLLVLAGCVDRVAAPVIAADTLSGGHRVEVLVATNRARNEAGFFDRGRQQELQFARAEVSIPPVHRPGDAPRYSPEPKPDRHFALTAEDPIAGERAFVAALRQALSQRPPEHREVTLYVHGFYNGYADAVFRMAQMHSDFAMKGVPVAFSWPSAASPAGYAYDRDSVLYSRDALERVIGLAARAGARNLVLLGHSMGSFLVMETLRQADLKRPGWVAQNVDAVVLMSPDISVDVFRAQTGDMRRLPREFIVVTSQKDVALRLSTRVSLERDRLGLGNSAATLSDLPITFVDLTDFSDRDTNSHFVAAESPALIALIAAANDLPGHVEPGNRTL
ncbi:alpha/beta hydrolase, partial [Shimia sp.]|uniref:alpha/beta hydrolase n=1 Tax=Shimia sp. TaxID=1954381 RepID=UPI0035668348